MESTSIKQETHSPLFDALGEHEQLMFCQDAATGLRAIIGVHNTVLGPALGGTRFWNYAQESDAVTDVLRLSRGMTFKAALAGLDLGGGKAVILGDPRKIKNEALLRRFGRFVENLNGKYITAEDVGVDTRDMTFIRRETEHVVGLPESSGGSGDPSPVTAYGVFMGIKAALKYVTGNESLENKRVVVQGVGKVGGYLVERLRQEHAQVYIYDLSQEAVQKLAKQTGAVPIPEDAVYTTDCDIYAPCALGGTLNPTTIPQLKCTIVAGAANNQLLQEQRDGTALQERGILYAPDFLINAGGLINVSTEKIGYNHALAMARTEGIYQTTLRVFKQAQDHNQTTHQAALQLALTRIEEIGKIKQYR